jgi:hypothetical protein
MIIGIVAEILKEKVPKIRPEHYRNMIQVGGLMVTGYFKLKIT